MKRQDQQSSRTFDKKECTKQATNSASCWISGIRFTISLSLLLSHGGSNRHRVLVSRLETLGMTWGKVQPTQRPLHRRSVLIQQGATLLPLHQIEEEEQYLQDFVRYLTAASDFQNGRRRSKHNTANTSAHLSLFLSGLFCRKLTSEMTIWKGDAYKHGISHSAMSVLP